MASEPIAQDVPSGERAELRETEPLLQPASEGAIDPDIEAARAEVDATKDAVLPKLLSKITTFVKGLHIRASVSKQTQNTNRTGTKSIFGRLRGTTKGELERRIIAQGEEISTLQERLRNVREYMDDSFEDWRVTMVNFKAMLPATITAIQNLERHCKLGPFAETGDTLDAKLLAEVDIHARLDRLEEHCKLGEYVKGD